MVLAVESATELAGVALADEDGVLASVALARGRRHAEAVVPAVAFACRHAGVALAELDAVVVDVGPGLFTGLRVGVATAQALAFALARPLVGVSSLQVLAAAAAGAGLADGAAVTAVVDARRGEVFAGRFVVGGGEARPDGVQTRSDPGRLAAELAGDGRPVVLVGDGARRYAATLAAVPGARLAAPWFDHPAPSVLARLGRERAAAGEGGDAPAVLPNYLRGADVRINWERRARRAAPAPARSPRAPAGSPGGDPGHVAPPVDVGVEDRPR